MALVEVKFNPSSQDLTWFGLLLLLFFVVLGGLVFWLGQSSTMAIALWATGAILSVSYYLVQQLRVPMYRMWMYLFFPIGWAVSHVMFGLIFFVILTPIGLLMRWGGRDPMESRQDPGKQTYWIKRRQDSAAARYLRQF